MPFVHSPWMLWQLANSGHPGAPMGMADIAEVLWRDYLSHNPADPQWMNRDRFVLSNGHASMLLYSLLHLTGYPLTIDDLRAFRQLGSHTAGHPEREPHLGIETTTGPLGQGIANAVGMALAEKLLAAQFNRPGHEVVEHRTWVFVGDGCLMEGISHEACSLAGTLKLGKLVVFFDDNGISIDGDVRGWCADDAPARFESYGWHVIRAVDGHDPEAIRAAIDKAVQQGERPTLICCKTVIGWGAATKAGSKSTHGEALGAEEVAATRVKLGWTSPPFEIPAPIRSAWDQRSRGGAPAAGLVAAFCRLPAGIPGTGAGAVAPAVGRTACRFRCHRTARAGCGAGGHGAAGHAPVIAAGAQCHRAFTWRAGRWFRPISPAPTTPSARIRRRSRPRMPPATTSTMACASSR